MSERGMNEVDPFFELKRAYEDYKVFDAHFEKVGKVRDIFVDDLDSVRYIGVGTGLLNMDFVLVPVEIIRINDRRQVIEIDGTEAQISDAPSFSDPSSLTLENLDSVHRHFGLRPLLPASPRGDSRDPSYPDDFPLDDSRVDLVPGEREEQVGHIPDDIGTPPRDPDLDRVRERDSAGSLRRFTR